MTHFKTSLTILAFALGLSTTSHAQLFGGLDNNTLLGGATGAGLGAVIGSNIAPSGNRTEGSAIGALVGGLAGASFGNQRSTYYGNPYAGQFNPGFNGGNLFGTLAGAGIGGAIGSNLAGSGVRQEGTTIGATLGGLAGYALANRGRGQSSRQHVPAYGQAYPYYGGGYATPQFQPTPYNVVSQPFTQTHYVSGTTFSNPAPIVQPRPIILPPKYIQPTITQLPAIHAPATPTQAVCYSGSTKRYDLKGHLIRNCN